VKTVSAEPRHELRHHVRIVSAASLFDGHDAAINVMRRLLQAAGAEVIHLGHNRSVGEIVRCAIQEDVQGIAITSYQGGHVEYFKYMIDLLREAGARVQVVGGGGGTILPAEVEELQAYGVARIYTPDDGRAMGLQGMIDDVLTRCDFEKRCPDFAPLLARLPERDPATIGGLITIAENFPEAGDRLRAQLAALPARNGNGNGARPRVLGITGTGGSGKSSVVDELVRRFLSDTTDQTIALLSVDPSKRKSGGALLGDRIRMNAIDDPRVYMRSLATRQANLALSKHVGEAIEVCRSAGFDLIVVETSGIGQSDTEITDHSDASLYVMTAEYGAATQLEKIDMLDFADVIAINKFDKRGSLDALRDVKKQWRRNHNAFAVADEEVPVYGTVASQFNDPGMNQLYQVLMQVLRRPAGAAAGAGAGAPSALATAGAAPAAAAPLERRFIIPPDRTRYLAEIAETCEAYDQHVREQAAVARRMYQLRGAIELLRENVGRRRLEIVEPAGPTDTVQVTERVEEQPELVGELTALYRDQEARLDPENRKLIEDWPTTRRRYAAAKYQFQVRDKTIELDLSTETLSHLRVPKVALPRYEDWGDLLTWLLREAPPGQFPFTAGVFPLKRDSEDPARMFAGEGGPERTNRRFHYVSRGLPAKRLSTAFDSVTLYGEDPDRRPDIYGKVGNSGVSVASVDDAKKLYSGFDLADPGTSVSMTINGPAPMLLGFFLNAAIDQGCEKWIRSQGGVAEIEGKIDQIYQSRGLARPRYQGALPEGSDGLGLLLLGVSGDQVLPRETYEKIRAATLSAVRGTVQADILKEDQAQNTCIFSTEFALRLMGDIQAYFIERKVRNFYSVSISGYHIAEAGANPISQLAFTLANGFTYVEYYLSRGMRLDDFAPNLSFFFSNGMDPEYTVIGRVARRIWSRTIRDKYAGNDRSQKLKYHIQTSGRSLHAQEIAFNDIRTTLQALLALQDNCNSLHTNAYDEAITTPTEESVRRALAIQLIINKEFGLSKNENPTQGSFIVEELTDLVEAAVLAEFRALSERGGVLGAMERMYQRSKIQEESLYYETLKHDGRLPLIGVNTFLDPAGSPTVAPPEVIRATSEEKDYAIAARDAFRERNAAAAPLALQQLKQAALDGANIFASLMEACKVCTLGQLSAALYQVGGQYRRNM
jgi:isobutyryl-CoA mutase